MVANPLMQNKLLQQNLNPYKAPGPSGISNSILKTCTDILAPHLANIYQATCNLHHYPKKFSNIHQIVLLKPGCPSYEVPTAYCSCYGMSKFSKLLKPALKKSDPTS